MSEAEKYRELAGSLRRRAIFTGLVQDKNAMIAMARHLEAEAVLLDGENLLRSAGKKGTH